MNNNYNIEQKQTKYITTETSDFINKTINRFIKSKDRTSSFLNFVDELPPEDNPLTDNTIEAVNGCGSWLEFRNYYRIDKTKLQHANFCKKDKLCPACARRRAAKQVQKVHRYISGSPDLLKKNWYFMVLPIKHTKDESFKTVFERLRSSMQKLRKSLDNGKRRSNKGFFSKFDGMFYSFEVTKSKNGWNCHVNLLGCTDQEIEGIKKIRDRSGKETFVHDEIMKEWKNYTGDSYVHSINKIDVSNEDLLIKNIMEVFKYSLKFQDLKNEDLLEVYRGTYRKRLLGGYGSLYGIKTDVDLEGDEILDDRYLEIVYRYSWKDKKYVHEKTKEVVQEHTVLPLKKFFQDKPIVNKKKPKYLPVEILNSSGDLLRKEHHLQIRNFTDHEIFSISQRKSPAGYRRTSVRGNTS